MGARCEGTAASALAVACSRLDASSAVEKHLFEKCAVKIIQNKEFFLAEIETRLCRRTDFSQVTKDIHPSSLWGVIPVSYVFWDQAQVLMRGTRCMCPTLFQVYC